MRLTGWGRAAIFGAMLGLAAAPALAGQDTETVNKTVSFPSDGHLVVHTFSGTVHITGTGGHDVVIKAVRTADRDQLQHISLSIDTSGSTVTIDTNKRDAGWTNHDNNVVKTDLTIEVPSSATLDVNGFSSPLDVSGVTGRQKLDTFNGTITVTAAKGAVDAHTFSGKIDLDVAGAGSSPQVTAQTFSGSIRAKLADSAKADVNFDSFSGQFDSEIPLSMHTMHRGRVSGHVGSDSGSSASLTFKTFSGDVKVVK